MHYQLITINGPEDLPKESGEYRASPKDDEIVFYNYKFDNGKDDINYWLANIHSYYSPVEVDDWVSVEERLPEDSITMLCYSAGGKISKGWYNGHYKQWMHYKMVKKNVTHWRTLPAPPSSPTKQP